MFAISYFRERDIDFFGGRATLRKVLMDLGFNFQVKNGLQILIEQRSIAAKRLRFLVQYNNNHTSPNPKDVVSQDETWEYIEGQGKGKTWQDSTAAGQRLKDSLSGARLTISHCEPQDGFIPGSLPLFCSARIQIRLTTITTT